MPRSYAAQVIRHTVRRKGAMLGLAWIAVVAAGAVLAPFVANTHPIYLKMDGRASSPMLRFLRPADVVLPVLVVTVGVLLLLSRVGPQARLAAFAIVLVTAVSAAILLVRPPQSVWYPGYREAAAAGKVQAVRYAIVPFSPADRLRDQRNVALRPPDGTHWMGTDESGADVFSGMLHACRISLSVGFISTGIAMTIGCFVGGMMGYFAGATDILGMRLIEIFSAIPTLFLLLMFAAVAGEKGHNLYLIMAIIGLTSWEGYARFVRAEFLKLRGQDFVHAAVAAGLPLRSVLFRHMLPNALSPVLVSASFGVASAILTESILSFLGLGLIDEPSWGRLLNQALGIGGNFYWWLATYPGVAIFLTVFAYNLVGEALRDALDPRQGG